jgi:predicted nucleic acid-binding protein
MMIVYVDSSIVLRHLLGQVKALRWADWQAAYSSEILGLEVRRVIDRLRLNATLDDNGIAYAQQALTRLERSIGQISLTRRVMRRAALPMPTSVKTLDAIHLASALLFQERIGDTLVFATHDVQQATGARALGFEVIG